MRKKRGISIERDFLIIESGGKGGGEGNEKFVVLKRKLNEKGETLVSHQRRGEAKKKKKKDCDYQKPFQISEGKNYFGTKERMWW